MPTIKPLINTDTDEAMRHMAKYVEQYTMGDYGFMILVFPFGENPTRIGHYISNCDRESMIKALREKADVLEQNMDIQNNGTVQ